MMKGRRALVLALFAVFLLSACVPESEHPLSDPKTAEYDARLIGTWLAQGEDGDGPAWLHFAEGPDSMTEIVAVSLEKGKGADVSFYRMHPTTVGGHSYMNVKPYAPDKYRTAEAAQEIASSRYLFLNYEITPEGILLIRLVEEGGLKEAVKEGRLKGEIKKSQYFEDVMLTDTTENLAKYFETVDPKASLEPFLKCRKAAVTPP